MSYFRDKMKRNRAGFIMALAAVLLVLGWRAVIVFRKPAHWHEIAAELGAVPQYTRHMIYPNHSGTCLVYGQQMENSLGLYFCDVSTRKPVLVCENNPQFYGWSPDDQRFAYGASLTNDPGRMALIICDGKTGAEVVRLQHPGFAGAGYNMPRTFTWLDASNFAFYANASIGVIGQRADGTWYRAKTIQVGVRDQSGITGISAGMVGWKNGNTIEALDLNSGIIQTIWKSETNVLEDFISSPLESALLLTCMDQGKEYLLHYSLRSRVATYAGEIDSNHHAIFRIHSVWNDDCPTFVSWDGNLPQTVYLSDDGLNAFHIGACGTVPARTLNWGAGVMTHSCMAGHHLFIAGHSADGMCGIWDYDAARDVLERITPEANPVFKYAKFVTPGYGLFTNSIGQTKGYSIWPPAHLVAGRKYPLILGQTANGAWFPIEQTAANCDCYIAVVHRPYWICHGLNDWPADVAGLYDTLRQNPNVDTNRVFLWGTSAETGALAQLFYDQADHWRGAIVFSPGGGITGSRAGRGKKVFLIAGDKSGDALPSKKYQNRALPEGVAVKLYLQDDKQHSPDEVRTQRDRAEIFARILNEDL